MKILVSDHLHEAGIEILKTEAEVEVATGLSKEELIEKIRDKDALLVRSATKVTADVIEAAERLKVIGRAGVGVDNIDLDAATKRGIVVVNAPEASSITVAEHTMGLMLSLARKIPFADSSLKTNKWEKKKFLGVELRGKTLGIIGLGRIGSRVAKKARAFEMEVIAYDPYISEKLAKELGVELVGFEELLRRSDFITIHVPLTEKTRGLIGKKEIEKMKDGAYIINCARGGIVDEKALYDGLKSGKLGGAALDVFEKEPPIGNPLLKLDNIIVTPHLGASTEEAQIFASVIACKEVLKVLRNEPPRYSVNMPAFEPEVLKELSDYLPLAEGMGRFAIQLVGGRIKDVSVTYCGKLLQVRELNALTNSLLKGILEPILTSGVNLLNAPVLARNRGIRITEGKRDDAEDYESMIILGVKTDEEGTQVKGTLLGERPRIVEIDGYKVDFEPKGDFLLVKHEDKPGMIGRVALSLGENKINIGSMQVGRKEVGGIQLMVLTVDHEVPNEVLDTIYSIDGIKMVKTAKM
jgi:D-3-phosphoglycerate dehydrogenase